MKEVIEAQVHTAKRAGLKQKGNETQSRPLQNSRLEDGGARGRLPPSHFTHKPIPRCNTFLIMELRQSFSKALADDIRMHSQATSCVIIYVSANQLRFHTHFFNSLKNEKHDYKLHPWYREITPHYLALWQIYNKIPAVSMPLKIHVVGFSSSFKTQRDTFLSRMTHLQ